MADQSEPGFVPGKLYSLADIIQKVGALDPMNRMEQERRAKLETLGARVLEILRGRVQQPPLGSGTDECPCGCGSYWSEGEADNAEDVYRISHPGNTLLILAAARSLGLLEAKPTAPVVCYACYEKPGTRTGYVQGTPELFCEDCFAYEFGEDEEGGARRG